MDVLPRSMPTLEGYELAGWNRPADQAGGDIYDAVSLNENQILLLLGDASGHGIGPALEIEYETGGQEGPFDISLFIKGHATRFFGDVTTESTSTNTDYIPPPGEPAEQFCLRAAAFCASCPEPGMV